MPIRPNDGGIGLKPIVGSVPGGTPPPPPAVSYLLDTTGTGRITDINGDPIVA